MFLLRGMMKLIAKTTIGELAATDHCRNAVTEMEWLDICFERLRAEHPGCPVPVWDQLRGEMPSWEEIHRTYDRRNN